MDHKHLILSPKSDHSPCIHSRVNVKVILDTKYLISQLVATNKSVPNKQSNSSEKKLHAKIWTAFASSLLKTIMRSSFYFCFKYISWAIMWSSYPLCGLSLTIGIAPPFRHFCSKSFCSKGHTCNIFLGNLLYKDLRNDNPRCQTPKYTNTNTQIQLRTNFQTDLTCGIFLFIKVIVSQWCI